MASKRIVLLDERAFDTLQQIVRWWGNIRGPGVTNTRDGLTINPPTPTPHRNTVQTIDRSRFLARITGNASLATNRWKYAWTEVELNGDATADVTSGRSGTTATDYAINLLEINHTSQYAWGVDMNAADYPDGFAPRPVGGGGDSDTHKTDIVVEMVQTVDSNGDTKYHFSAMGSHDGSCTA